jgi:hypothetical protein
VLLPVGAPGVPCPPFMFVQWCAGLWVDDGEGAVVADVEDDVVDTEVAECVVAALATAMLAPSPTPSAPAPTAVPIMILPSLVFNASASKR